MSSPTLVLFRRWPKRDGGDVIALFPLLAETRPGEVTCYAHVGQHGAAHLLHVIARTRPADEEDADVRALRAELERIGYRLEVCKRSPSWRRMRAAREADGGAP